MLRILVGVDERDRQREARLLGEGMSGHEGVVILATCPATIRFVPYHYPIIHVAGVRSGLIDINRNGASLPVWTRARTATPTILKDVHFVGILAVISAPSSRVSTFITRDAIPEVKSMIHYYGGGGELGRYEYDISSR